MAKLDVYLRRPYKGGYVNLKERKIKQMKASDGNASGMMPLSLPIEAAGAAIGRSGYAVRQLIERGVLHPVWIAGVQQIPVEELSQLAKHGDGMASARGENSKIAIAARWQKGDKKLPWQGRGRKKATA